MSLSEREQMIEARRAEVLARLIEHRQACNHAEAVTKRLSDGRSVLTCKCGKYEVRP